MLVSLNSMRTFVCNTNACRKLVRNVVRQFWQHKSDYYLIGLFFSPVSMRLTPPSRQIHLEMNIKLLWFGDLNVLL